MTKEERRFKILKKKKYEEQISKEDKNAIFKALSMGLNAIVAVACLLTASQDASTADQLSFAAIGLLNAGFGANQMKGLMESISRKTMLKGKVDDIITELQMSKNEESRGMSR